jgi:integrase/recombinase XerD
MLAAVRGLHSFALKERWTMTDSCALLVSSKPAVRLPKALSVGDTLKVVEVLGSAESATDMRDYAVVEFLYSTGARISEVVGLTLDDLDLKGGSVRLFGKGSKYRIVPIGGAAIAALERYIVRARPSLVKQTTNVVFLNRKGEPLGRQSAFNAVSRCAELAQIKQAVSPHTLRHCFATHLLEGGADVRVVQELLGHASVTTTQIYTLVTQQRLREVYSMAHPRSRR